MNATKYLNDLLAIHNDLLVHAAGWRSQGNATMVAHCHAEAASLLPRIELARRYADREMGRTAL